MMKTKATVRNILVWVFWIVVVQLVLANISAASYAYKFTHFKQGPPPPYTHKNIFTKTWKLFVGPDVYKLPATAAPAFPVEEIHFATNDSININGWYSDSDSANACVILCHGYTVDKSSLLDEAAQFRAWGYNVLLFDFRGHGNSEGVYSSFGNKESEEVAKAFAFAKAKGNQNIILYGVSMGSMAVLKSVSENNLQPAAIITDMPFGSLQDHFKSRAQILGFPSQPFAFLISTWIGIEQGFNPYTFKACNYAKHIHCPVLQEWGEKDVYVKRKETDEIFNCLASAKKKLLVYPDANHESFVRVDPDQWKAGVQIFLTHIH
ncbi:MAG: hypothetical protein C4330_06365 [Chitinophagaceae bacterium]